MCKCNQHATPSPQQPDQLQPDALKMLLEENIMRQQTQTITKDQSIQYELLHSSNKVNFSRVPIADIFQTKRRRRRRQVSPLSIVVDVMPLHVMSSVYCSCMMKTICATIVLLLCYYTMPYMHLLLMLLSKCRSFNGALSCLAKNWLV